MKRRNFLAASTLSLGAIIHSKASSVGFFNSIQEQNFFNYVDHAEGVSQSLFLLDDQPLLDLYSVTSKQWKDLGYHNTTNKFYYLGRSGVAMFPLFLEGGDAGTIDVSALFFEKNPAGIWKSAATFSGYHFDALNQALGNLSVKPERAELARLITPVLSKSREFVSGSIQTLGGRLELITRIGKDTTSLDFKLVQGNRLLLSSVFKASEKASVGRLA